MRPVIKISIVVAILMVTFGLPVLLEHSINPRSTPSSLPITPTLTEVIATDDIRFLSIPPVIVPANSVFLYKFVTASLSGEKVSVSVPSKPTWLEWDESTEQLKGTVPAIGGVFSVTMRATTLGGASADQTFTVTIDAPPEVKGATTVSLWRDPFHPNFSEVQNRELTVLPDVATSDLLPEVDVLGEKTIRDTRADLIKEYGAWGILALLFVLVGLLIAKIIKVIRTSRAEASSGVIIERGQR